MSENFKKDDLRWLRNCLGNIAKAALRAADRTEIDVKPSLDCLTQEIRKELESLERAYFYADERLRFEEEKGAGAPEINRS